MNMDPRAGRGRTGAPAQTQAQALGPAGQTGAGCPACGGRVRPARVSTALWEGDALAVVRDVPALVCQSCHERFFQDDTVMRLDLLRAGGFAGQAVAETMRVPVYAFPRADGHGEGT